MLQVVRYATGERERLEASEHNLVLHYARTQFVAGHRQTRRVLRWDRHGAQLHQRRSFESFLRGQTEAAGTAAAQVLVADAPAASAAPTARSAAEEAGPDDGLADIATP